MWFKSFLKRKRSVLFLCVVIIQFFAGCNISHIPEQERKEIFNQYIKPIFPSEYYIQDNAFTKEEIETIQQGFKNWEPIIRKLTATNFHFKYLGLADFPTDSGDQVHIVRREAFDEPHEHKLAKAHHLLDENGNWSSVGGDIVINEWYGFHTQDQWHMEGLREVFFSFCLEGIVTHEVGHLIGMQHSNHKEDIMYFKRIPVCDRKPTPHDEQVLGFVYLQYLRHLKFPED
ncbi:MAG: matrixin family metalloprotease [Deltaproteobacteria bacterium]|nr:matrixin family metalloprotease [Deltaproteobacteria bacterium]